MIPPIKIDLSDILAEFDIPNGIADEMVDTIVKGVATRFYETWSVIAGRELHSSRRQYITALQLMDEGKMKAAIVLHGKLPNMIESGASAFDMKDGFEKSSKKKHTKNGGWYLTIPFRLAAPGSLGESEIFAGKLPKEVHAEIKKLTSTRSEFKSGVSFGESLKKSSIPEKYRDSKSRPAFSDTETKKTFEEYKHKSSIYEGVMESKKTYQNATQSMFNSFRRVSNNSDPNSWIHSGIRAHNLAEKAFSEFNLLHEVDILVDSQLANFGF